MRKKFIILLAMLFTVKLFSSSSAFAGNDAVKATDYVCLPYSLLEIEEEAFSGTAVEKVIFPDGLLYIGIKAFSGATRLSDIYIPSSVEFIDDTSFRISSSLIIHGIRGSYAQDWAEKHKIQFVEENIWKHIYVNRKIVNEKTIGVDFLYRKVVFDRFINLVPRAEDENVSKRPQDRPELNPIDYRFP